MMTDAEHVQVLLETRQLIETARATLQEARETLERCHQRTVSRAPRVGAAGLSGSASGDGHPADAGDGSA